MTYGLESIGMPKTISEAVYQALEEAIVTGKLPQGAPLVEGEVARRLGVSKTPVREAITRLTQEGLVVNTTRKTPHVVTLGESDVRELYDIREMLERLAVRYAVELIDARGIATLRELIRRQSEHLSRDEFDLSVKANADFHLTILGCAGNQRLSEMVTRIRNQMRLLQSASVRFPGSSARSVEEHAEITRLMENGDQEAAERLMADHIQRAKHEMLAHLAAVGESGIAQAGEGDPLSNLRIDN